jgi:molybdopterin-guanine dinucleotide biosynthesis protein A
VIGAILAGGGATRFGGRPKGLETVGGARILDRVARALAPVCDDLLLVANATDAEGWLHGARVVSDVWPGLGSLGGLHAALAHARGAVLVVAWDMPFVTSALLGALRDLGAGGARAARPVHADGRAEPLCAWYDARCLDVAERLLDAGERRARTLGDTVAAAALQGSVLAAFGDPRLLLSSVNTPDDLARARAAADALEASSR